MLIVSATQLKGQLVPQVGLRLVGTNPYVPHPLNQPLRKYQPLRPTPTLVLQPAPPLELPATLWGSQAQLREVRSGV